MTLAPALFSIALLGCALALTPLTSNNYPVHYSITNRRYECTDENSIYAAVNMWRDDEAAAVEKYGHIRDWDTSKVTVMAHLFTGATLFNADISNWDVSSATTMVSMFAKCKSFNVDIRGWNVGRVSAMALMFKGTASFNQNLHGWTVGQVSNWAGVFTDSGMAESNKPCKFQADPNNCQTPAPSKAPTYAPTAAPTTAPTCAPTMNVTSAPTLESTSFPAETLQVNPVQSSAIAVLRGPASILFVSLLCVYLSI